jgi:hypothetical protein
MVSNEARAKGRAIRALTTWTCFLAHLFVKTCTLYILYKGPHFKNRLQNQYLHFKQGSKTLIALN